MGKAEASVENYLVKQCKRYDILCFKFTSPGHTGVPDRILIANNKVVFAELKSNIGRTSRKQDHVINDMINHGAIVSVLSTKEEVDEMLSSLFLD